MTPTSSVIASYKKFLELKKKPDMIKMASELDTLSRTILTYVDIFKSTKNKATEEKIVDAQQLYNELKEKYDNILSNCFTSIVDEYPDLVRLFLNSPHDLRIDMIELALNEKKKMEEEGKSEIACVRTGLSYTENVCKLPKGFYNKDDRTIKEFLKGMREGQS